MSSDPFRLDGGPPGHDEQLAREVLADGRSGERAALELLLRRRPDSWTQAVALLEAVGVPSPGALRALADAWRRYRRVEQPHG